ncbi:STAS domain-containing protein [Streptomyces sp. NPDC058423]|uniref:STAS domain-containing protein n=1 Tax=unclassified Streptomyces TaxID=2593676 RepID=UPI00365B2D0F
MFSGVDHLSADGTGALFIALRAARSQGTRVTVANAPPQAATMLRRVGLWRLVGRAAGEDNTGT